MIVLVVFVYDFIMMLFCVLPWCFSLCSSLLFREVLVIFMRY